MTPPSLRWSWCTGDGRWEKWGDRGGVHHAMYVQWEGPNERNFDGTPEELARFITARRLLAEDDLEFERRIDRSSSESFSDG